MITEPFERCLGRRGITEEELTDMNHEKPRDSNRHSRCVTIDGYREIKPEGWQAVKGGIAVAHKDFGAEGSDRGALYMTRFPSCRGGRSFLGQLLKGLGPNE